MADLKAEIGKRIREARKAKGLTQADVSAMACISKSFLSEVETGKRNIAASRLVRLADVCGVSAGDLLTGLTASRVVDLGVIEFHSERVNPGLIQRFYAVRDDLTAAGCIVDIWLMDIATVLAEFGYRMTVTTQKPKPEAAHFKSTLPKDNPDAEAW